MNILGIDFEEWFHPELVKPFIKNHKKEFKTSKGLKKILEWLNKNETFATFFVVGEIFEEDPEMIDLIIQDGHEIGFHTMTHKKLHEIKTRENFEKELDGIDQATSGRIGTSKMWNPRLLDVVYNYYEDRINKFCFENKKALP